MTTDSSNNPKDIQQFIKQLEAKLKTLPEPERQQMIQIIQGLIKLLKEEGSDQTKH